jgi:hypothetical protein
MTVADFTLTLAKLTRYGFDMDAAEPGATDHGVMLRSEDERWELVLYPEDASWSVHYTTHASDSVTMHLNTTGEGWDHLLDTLDAITDFANDMGV